MADEDARPIEVDEILSEFVVDAPHRASAAGSAAADTATAEEEKEEGEEAAAAHSPTMAAAIATPMRALRLDPELSAMADEARHPPAPPATPVAPLSAYGSPSSSSPLGDLEARLAEKDAQITDLQETNRYFLRQVCECVRCDAARVCALACR
jgi:hypothetical protein